MKSLNFGHGFVPRLSARNYKAVERALGQGNLFEDSPAEIPWVIADGSWLRPDLPVLGLLKQHHAQLIVDTQGWRFAYPAAQEIRKLTQLPHAPTKPLDRKDNESFAQFVADDLQWQEKLGADAYLLPTLLIDTEGELGLALLELATEVAITTDGLGGKPLIGSVFVRSRFLDALIDAIGTLPDLIAGLYVQVTPVNPCRDSVGRLSQLGELMFAAQRTGKPVIAGRLAAYGGVLRAIGIAAADAGTGDEETFDYTRLIRPRRKHQSGSKGGGVGSRRYVSQLQRSLSTKQWDRFMDVPILRSLLDCKETCCRFKIVSARGEWAREHSLRSRITEARDLAELPASMRASRQRDILLGARSAIATVNHVLQETGLARVEAEHVENQLRALENLMAKKFAA